MIRQPHDHLIFMMWIPVSGKIGLKLKWVIVSLMSDQFPTIAIVMFYALWYCLIL